MDYCLRREVAGFRSQSSTDNDHILFWPTNLLLPCCELIASHMPSLLHWPLLISMSLPATEAIIFDLVAREGLQPEHVWRGFSRMVSFISSLFNSGCLCLLEP
jgi:hypothetical protein